MANLFKFRYIKSGNKFLIGGDLNAHHFSWGSIHNCHNRNIIYNFTNANQFMILNGNTTYVASPNFSNSCIDLTFVSPALALDWKVENDV